MRTKTKERERERESNEVIHIYSLINAQLKYSQPHK